jgi:hypothetical protein
MKRSFSLLILALALASSVAAAAAAAGDRDARVTAELGRLDAKLAEIAPALPKDFDGGKDAQATLDRVRRANGADYRLYRMRDAFVSVETLAFVAANRSATESLDRFDALWSKQQPRFRATPPTPRGSVLERAPVESASTRASRLFAASRPYAKASSPSSGVYYLGEAEANLRFAQFVTKNSTASARGEKSSTRARMASSLATLEQSMLEFFKGDVTSPNAIPVSVRIKEARELLAAGRVDGAALLAIEARLTMTRRGGPKGSYPPASLDASASIPSLLASWAADEQPPMSESIRSEVVPFWASLLLPAQKISKAPALVTVTLVRWPYT